MTRGTIFPLGSSSSGIPKDIISHLSDRPGRRRSLDVAVSAVALICALASADLANAQTAASPPADAGQSGVSATKAGAPAAKTEPEEIIVTGSHIARSTFSTPSPITVVSSQNMQLLGITNVGVALGALPAFRADLSPKTNGFANFNIGAQIANLRGLGATRTLVLVDGNRFVTSTREGSVDLNLIPTIMIDRTEIVTGGASAAYGSDAIAGAINIILDNKLNGIKGQVDYGITGHGDGEEFHVALAGGTDFFDGRGHIIAGGEYDKTERHRQLLHPLVLHLGRRGPQSARPNHDPNAAGEHHRRQQCRLAVLHSGRRNSRQRRQSPALWNMQFNANGDMVPYDPGTYGGAGFSVSPDNVSSLRLLQSPSPGQAIRLHSRRLRLDVQHQGVTSRRRTAIVEGSNLPAPRKPPTIGIKRDNAYCPAELQKCSSQQIQPFNKSRSAA